MPWDETTSMTQRARFLVLVESGLYTMTELCERFGVSRKTGYKWVSRYVELGEEGLADGSRAPLSCPHKTSAELEEVLVAARRQHPGWGPRKLLAWCAKRQPEVCWPSASTVGVMLKRHGLVEAVRARRSRAPVARTKPLTVAQGPNQVWTSDFKGEFRTSDRWLCYPLTVVDAHSRFLLGVEGLDSTGTTGALRVYERLFEEYGLPEVMRSDNGCPFASTALGGLSRLSVSWIKLGIRLERIDRGHPEQNGSHERMHRTLKAQTARPPAADRRAQQQRFDVFREEYNEERPHEGVGNQTPSQLYQRSLRAYPGRVPEPDYPGHFEVRCVRPQGEIRWQGDLLFVSQALAGERVGLEESEEGVWSLYFSNVLLGRFDERDRKLYG
jgi:transposase InsO family protein